MKINFINELLRSRPFCDISPDARSLYCPLVFSADAKGIAAYHETMILYGASFSALQELEKQGFLLLFPEQEVAVIVHYPVLNPVKGRTLYPAILKQVKTENGQYHRITQS